ncbi:hypothetical protein [Breoghania sp.]|uniref:hypothetical protein n=1 Tax=Breoghania sp. TaxID=2065378 RepID=UPI002AA89E06|nr:hypothetical protein [Breoghania sp.]
MIQPSVFSLRSPIAVIAAAALGILVAATGYLVQNSADATRMETQVTAEAAMADSRLSLARTLLQHSLVSSAQRLEELANLPLLAEFLDLAASNPTGGDAAELRAYLGEALQAAAQSPDIAALIAFAPSGEALMSIGETDDNGPKPAPGETIRVVSGAKGAATALWLQAKIPPLDGGGASSGFLLARLPHDILQSLAAADIRVSRAEDQESGPASESPAVSRLGPLLLRTSPPGVKAQPSLSALYWLFAGICVFLAGLAGLAARRTGTSTD